MTPLRSTAVVLTTAAALVVAPRTSALQAQAHTSTPVRLETASGTLSGTRTAPAAPGRHPALLLISGSGPTDRDGNSTLLPGPNNSLKLLAEALAASGYATVRYDKRGIGASAAAARPESELRFETYTGDAADWLRQLRADSATCAVGVIGHSEGGLIGVVAAAATEADAVVMLTSPARPAASLIRDQLASQPDSVEAAAAAILDRLARGELVDSVPPYLWILFRPSVQPYLISWFRHDPAALLARLEIPALAVYGTSDIQVPASHAQVVRDAAPRASVVVIDGMNHVLKPVGADPHAQSASYSDPSLPLSPGLVTEIVGFLGQHLRCEGS